jgi:hypothetical protein
MGADGGEGVAPLVPPQVGVGHLPDAEAIQNNQKYTLFHGKSPPIS